MRQDSGNPLANDYMILDLPFRFCINRGQLVLDDDGLEFEYGDVRPGDHIRVAAYNEVYVNDVLRKLQNP